MDKQNKDSFEILKKNLSDDKSHDNFFINREKISSQNFYLNTNRHINDYDANLLENDAYKKINNDAFKAEYRISKIENEIKDINKQIHFRESIADTNVQDLIDKRDALIEEYKNIKNNYENMTFSSKLTSKITGVFDKNINKQSRWEKFFKQIFAKMPAKIKSIFYIRESIVNLIQISNSVDNLISNKTMYTNIDKYDEMSKYIIKANSLQNNLKKHIKKNL